MQTGPVSHPMTIPNDPHEQANNRAMSRTTIFFPGLLLAIAFVAWLAFQAVQLVGERQQLGLAMTSTEPQELAATKLRASLDNVATATAKLAADGNLNARVIVEELRKRGITINQPAAPKPP